MTGPAWATYQRALAGMSSLTARSPVCSAELALGSGLTGLAVEAAFRDVALARGRPPGRVLRDPDSIPDEGAGVRLEGPVLCCSFSGRSSEVVDGLAALRGRGVASLLHGAGWDADVRIPSGPVERPFQHIPFCATVPTLTGTPIVPRARDVGKVIGFLEKVAGSDRVAVFAAGAESFRARVLLSYWMEYVHGAGFLIRFPDFTHDLLWVMARSSHASAFAFVLERPRSDLSDRRFAQLGALLDRLGVPTLVLDPEPADQAGCHIGLLLAVAESAHALALSLGRELSSELTFESCLTQLERTDVRTR